MFRVGRGSNVFDPPDWELVGDDGTFGNRFDDPGTLEDPSACRSVIPAHQRFRVIYCATQRAGAYGETLARFRPDLNLMAKVIAVDDSGSPDPSLFRKTVPTDWRTKRRIGHVRLNQRLRFTDLHHGATMGVLRSELAPLLSALGLADLDLSNLTSSHRRLTQEISRFIFEQIDETGEPAFAGIRYVSRLHQHWECWAIFHERMLLTEKHSSTIFPDDDGLVEAARILGLHPPDAF